jgi:hypothetical protein
MIKDGGPGSIQGQIDTILSQRVEEAPEGPLATDNMSERNILKGTIEDNEEVVMKDQVQ